MLEREREIHESRSRNKMRSGASIWAKMERGKYFH